MADEPDGTRVGYACPPLHSRFKAGQSGNLHGRPRHTRNLKTILQQALTDRITIREGDKRRTISRLEGVVLRQIEGALKGSDRAALATLKIATQVGLLEDAENAFEAPPLTAAEQLLIDDLLKRAAPKAQKHRKQKP
jgi:hypothetical protein